MKVRFYLDPQTDLPHMYKHDVSDEDVEDILNQPGEDRPGQNGARVAIGQTRNGRLLKVIYVRDPEPDSVFVITAYELKGKPQVAYRRRQKRRR